MKAPISCSCRRPRFHFIPRLIISPSPIQVMYFYSLAVDLPGCRNYLCFSPSNYVNFMCQPFLTRSHSQVYSFLRQSRSMNYPMRQNKRHEDLFPSNCHSLFGATMSNKISKERGKISLRIPPPLSLNCIDLVVAANSSPSHGCPSTLIIKVVKLPDLASLHPSHQSGIGLPVGPF